MDSTSADPKPLRIPCGPMVRRVFAAALAASVLCALAPVAAQAASPDAELPGFWRRMTPVSEYADPPAGETGPIHDIRGNETLRSEGSYVRFIGDYNNPILQPWAAAKLKTHAEKVRSVGYNADSSDQSPAAQCRRSGVPNVWTLPLPVRILAQDGKLIMAWGAEYRVIRMNQPHLSNPKPTWYGDSVGHWEGDTLVIDTIAQRPETPVDLFETPHSDQIHVVERLRTYVQDGEKWLKVHVTVTDPVAYTRPWSAVIDYLWFPDAEKRPPERRGFFGVEISGAPRETVCAENNRNPNVRVTIPVNETYTYPE